ncbi:MAG: diguanylate cyclase [Phycisphaera sp.]|nr:diguanylate cyclase [Phycisphaera sp.]
MAVTATPRRFDGAMQRSAIDLFVVSQDQDLLSQIEHLATEADRSNPIGLTYHGAATGTEALGVLATQYEAAVVLCDVDALEEGPTVTSEALRTLLPNARLIAILPANRQADQPAASSWGFDSVIVQPDSREQLAGSLGITLTSGHDDIPHPAPSPSPQQELGTDELGDTDLIDTVMHNRASLRKTALHIITQRSDLPGLGWCQSEHDLPEGHAHARVEYHAQTFGLLHASKPVMVSELEAWAGWLARWLCLGQTMDQLWELSLRDELTGAWNRRYFNRFLNTILDRAASERFSVTVMIFDIDDFKKYNDTYGHAEGDEILRESARLMQSVVREQDIVARIGGDEFGVIFWDAEGPRKPNSSHPRDVALAAKRFQRAICEHKFPKLLDQAPGNLSISGGLASFPWDGRTADELVNQADQMAIEGKRQGKNVVKFGPGASRVCNGI